MQGFIMFGPEEAVSRYDDDQLATGRENTIDLS